MRPEPHHDELHTFRRETEPRRHCRNEGWIRAVAESHCRHDIMMTRIEYLNILNYMPHIHAHFVDIGFIGDTKSQNGRL